MLFSKVNKKQYGDACTAGLDYQCASGPNSICIGYCDCPLTHYWNGTACGNLILIFF